MGQKEQEEEACVSGEQAREVITGRKMVYVILRIHKDNDWSSARKEIPYGLNTVGLNQEKGPSIKFDFEKVSR